MVDGRRRVRSHFVRAVVWHTLSLLRNVRIISDFIEIEGSFQRVNLKPSNMNYSVNDLGRIYV